MRDAVIVEAVRTAHGKRNGRLSPVHPVDLLADVLSALVARAGLDPVLVDDVVIGCVSADWRPVEQRGPVRGARRRMAAGDSRGHDQPSVRVESAGA